MASPIDRTTPVGAEVTFNFNISGVVINESSLLTFTPLLHTPLTQPHQISYKTELNRVTVSYLSAAPSLTGEYVLCLEAPPYSKRRRRRGGEPVLENRHQICGDTVAINVTSTFLSRIFWIRITSPHQHYHIVTCSKIIANNLRGQKSITLLCNVVAQGHDLYSII